MKKLLLLLPLFALVWSCTPGGGGAAADSADLKTFIDSASYAQGMMMGQQIKTFQDGGEESLINSAALKAGLDQGLTGEDGLIPEAELQSVMMQFQMKLQQASQKKAQAEAAVNQAKGQAFLSENANKEGVVTTESGLQYKVITAGTGATPKAADQVQVDYEGRLIDGTVFDSSYGKKPITFGVGGVIRGWTEALQLMKEGAKYQLYIPAQLAYGERGSPPNIGPGETLIFDVELLKVNP